MEGITYDIAQYHGTFIVRMKDPLFGHPWYMKSFRKGVYNWTRDALYARPLSKETATRHVENLRTGIDEDWKVYHEHWRAYWESLKKIRQDEGRQ